LGTSSFLRRNRRTNSPGGRNPYPISKDDSKFNEDKMTPQTLNQREEELKKEIKETEKKLAELKSMLELEKSKNEWIKITFEGKTFEVQTKTQDMTYLEAEKKCINGLRMLSVAEAGHIFDNELIKNFAKEREWIAHYSQKTRKFGYKCSVVGLSESGGRLLLNGISWCGNNGGYAFGVRFVRDLK